MLYMCIWINVLQRTLLKCNPVVSCLFQHQANRVWDQEMLSPINILKDLRLFHLFLRHASILFCAKLLTIWRLKFFNVLEFSEGVWGTKCHLVLCREMQGSCRQSEHLHEKERLTTAEGQNCIIMVLNFISTVILLGFLDIFQSFYVCLLCVCSWQLAYGKPNMLLSLLSLF